MTFRYKEIHDLNEAHDDEQIGAVYENPIQNVSGTKDMECIRTALIDSQNGNCRLVVWRDDDNERYYRGIDKTGRIRDKEAPENKIIAFDPDRGTIKHNTGYKSFVKAALDSLCEGEPDDGKDYLIRIEGSNGELCIDSAHLDRDNGIISIVVTTDTV